MTKEIRSRYLISTSSCAIEAWGMSSGYGEGSAGTEVEMQYFNHEIFAVKAQDDEVN